MARNVTLNFGLLSIPMKSEVAVEKPVAMKNLCIGQVGKPDHDPLPTVAPTKCTECGPVDFTALVKGIPAGGGAFTVVTQEAIAEAKAEYAQQYKGALTLVPHDGTTFGAATAPGDTVHYLTPASAAAADHYALLARLVSSHPELAFVGLHTPSSVTALYQVVTRGGVLVMQKRVREQGMKPVPATGGTVNEQFYAMLEMSLPMLATDYTPEGYEDGYAAAVAAMTAADDAITVGTKAAPVQSDDALIAQFAALNAAS